MLITCWSVKGGSGVSVVAAALAGLMAERHRGAAVVDLGGDQPAVLGLAEPSGPGVRDWCDSGAPAAALSRIAIEVADDLRLVPRGEGARRIDAARAEHLRRAVEALAPVVVVDAGEPLSSSPPDIAGSDTPDSEAPDSAARLHAEWLRSQGSSLFVTRACYLSLRRAMRIGVDADGVVLVAEPGRALKRRDVADVLGLPVVGVVEADPAVARAVDAGTLARRVPGSLSRGLRRAG